MKNRTPKVLQEEYEADLKNMKERGTLLDENGKMYVYILREGKRGGMAYFYDKDSNAARLHTSTFYRLLEEDRAVRVDPETFI